MATVFGAASTSASDWKATRRPLGDQAGCEPNVVSALGAPPRAGTTQIPPRPFEWYAMVVPSGDQHGWKFCCPSRVSATSRPDAPSSRTQISKPPLRSELYTIDFPSGENDGCRSSPEDDVSWVALALRVGGGAVVARRIRTPATVRATSIVAATATSTPRARVPGRGSPTMVVVCRMGSRGAPSERAATTSPTLA